MRIIRRLMLLAFGLVLSSLANYSFAQPTEIVVARNPGGPIDTLARDLARLLQQESGGSVKVINMGGDNGKVAASYVRRFPGEQSKLLLSTQLAGAAAHDIDGLTPIIVVGTSAAWSQPLTLFAPPSLSQAQVSSLQRAASAAIMSAPFAATATRLSVAVSAEVPSKGPNAAGIAGNPSTEELNAARTREAQEESQRQADARAERRATMQAITDAANALAAQRQAAGTAATGSRQGGGELARSSSGTQSACKGSKEFCEVQLCQQRGGRPLARTNNLGCRVVTCGFTDTTRDYGSVISAPPGSGCAGYSK